MPKTNRTDSKGARQRQKRWRRRRQAEGMQSVTVMVPTEAKALLEREKRRTGETLSQVVERAVFALQKAAEGEKSPVKIRTDGETLSVQIPLSRVQRPASVREKPPSKPPPSADALLQGLIFKKRRP